MKNLLIILGCCVFLYLLYRFIVKIKEELESIDLDDTSEEPLTLNNSQETEIDEDKHEIPKEVVKFRERWCSSCSRCKDDGGCEGNENLDSQEMIEVCSNYGLYKRNKPSEGDVVYFSVNNWYCGRDYPNSDTFKNWMKNDLDLKLRNKEWAKKNKLCITCEIIDMSCGFAVSAKRDWVEKNCPEVLQSKFEYLPEPDGSKPEEGLYGVPFQEYCEENFGITWYEEPYEEDEYYDDED